MRICTVNETKQVYGKGGGINWGSMNFDFLFQPAPMPVASNSAPTGITLTSGDHHSSSDSASNSTTDLGSQTTDASHTGDFSGTVDGVSVSGSQAGGTFSAQITHPDAPGLTVNVNTDGQTIGMSATNNGEAASVTTGYTTSGQVAVQSSVNGVVSQTCTLSPNETTTPTVSCTPGGEPVSHSEPSGSSGGSESSGSSGGSESSGSSGGEATGGNNGDASNGGDRGTRGGW